MNFIVFPVESTNIFPLTNSTAGGQLVTEFNLRARESVLTDTAIQYFTGPSYAHSMSDFAVYSLRDGYDTSISNTCIQIQPGRALVAGYYVQSLTPVDIDLNDANYLAKKNGLTELKGRLSVGLKMIYNTVRTLAESAKVENVDNYYEGVEVVILPTDDVVLPADAPNESEYAKVNMDLLLGEFTYRNGSISKVKQNKEKIAAIESSRIKSSTSGDDDDSASTKRLDPNKLYIMAGKSKNGSKISEKPTWCDYTDGAIVWDKTPKIDVFEPSSESFFQYNPYSGQVELVLAHKQVDGSVNTEGTKVYYQDKTLALPSADFDYETGGVIDRAYIKRVKDLKTRVNNFYHLASGKMRAYKETLNNVNELPIIPMKYYNVTKSQSLWEAGDYVLVGQDNTQADNTGDSRPPATMYVVQAPQVATIAYLQGSDVTKTISYAKGKTSEEYLNSYYEMINNLPVQLQGKGGTLLDVYKVNSTNTDKDEFMDMTVSDWSQYTAFWNPGQYNGTPEQDYFIAIELTDIDSTAKTETYILHYYVVKSVANNGAFTYSDAIWLTGEIPLATESAIGGFKSVPADSYGQGYVYVDDSGHLKLVDYELLLNGILSYQLGEDYSTTGSTISDIQDELNEYINNRVAFPNANQTKTAQDNDRDPYVINVYLTLPDEQGTINLHDVGTRNNTTLYLHILGTATSALTLNISKCDQLRIDGNIAGAPNIVLDSDTLYYDPDALDLISTISNMKLWYHKFEDSDPDIQLNGMTVTLTTQVQNAETVDPWTEVYANDNHYNYALRSLTFADDGSIIKAGILVGDSTTANVDEGKSVFAGEFTLPQSAGLAYPETKMTHRLKITGSFVSHYYVAADDAYMMKVTQFSAITQKYSVTSRVNIVSGTIAFLTDAYEVDTIAGVEDNVTIDAWDLNTPHYFEGGIVE